ncbi:MAG: hypothetical protein ACR2PX_02475 [Endozoicomonas sp.]|uniref:hypothetical protein n=1 Tax=Endozoicomonas sp. TaxID=1892382 RepID=UPI003D9BE46F
MATNAERKESRLVARRTSTGIQEIIQRATEISTIGLFVDPMKPDVVPFYQQYGFYRLIREDSGRIEMWLLVATCALRGSGWCFTLSFPVGAVNLSNFIRNIIG